MDWSVRSLDFSSIEQFWEVLVDERESTILQQLTLTTCSTSCSRNCKRSLNTTDLHYLDCYQLRAMRGGVQFLACRGHLELLTTDFAVGMTDSANDLGHL